MKHELRQNKNDKTTTLFHAPDAAFGARKQNLNNWIIFCQEIEVKWAALLSSDNATWQHRCHLASWLHCLVLVHTGMAQPFSIHVLRIFWSQHLSNAFNLNF